jgi:hypothetical protein
VNHVYPDDVFGRRAQEYANLIAEAAPLPVRLKKASRLSEADAGSRDASRRFCVTSRTDLPQRGPQAGAGGIRGKAAVALHRRLIVDEVCRIAPGVWPAKASGVTSMYAVWTSLACYNDTGGRRSPNVLDDGAFWKPVISPMTPDSCWHRTCGECVPIRRK